MSSEKRIATPTYPIPVAMPAAIARKMPVISWPLPGAERNLTNEKAPATATPAPILPFTSIITSSTIEGSSIRVIRKLLEHLFLIIYAPAIIRPHTKDASVDMASSDPVKVPFVSIEEKIVSNICCNSFHYTALLYRARIGGPLCLFISYGIYHVCISGSVFGKGNREYPKLA